MPRARSSVESPARLRFSAVRCPATAASADDPWTCTPRTRTRLPAGNARDLATGQAFGVEFTFSGVIWVIDAHILPAILRRLGHLPDSGLEGARNSEEAELVSPREPRLAPLESWLPRPNSSVRSRSVSKMHVPGEK